MPTCIMQSCQLLVCEKKRESHTIMYQPPYLAYLKILHLLYQSNVFVLQHSSLFIYLQSNTYVVGTCNHTDVEKPNHPSMGPTHTPTILLCTFKVFHAFPPVQQTWTTMTWLPSPCRLGDMVWPSPAAWQVRSAQRHFGHQRDLATGQSRKQLSTRPSLATVASAVLPVHFFHNNDNQHAAWRGLCSYCRGNEGGKNGFNNSAMIGRESELWTGWLNNYPQDSNPRPHRRGSVVWTNYAMPYALCPMYIDMNDIHI